MGGESRAYKPVLLFTGRNNVLLHKMAMSIIMANIHDSKTYNSGTAGKRYIYVKEVTYRLPSSFSASIR